MANLSLITKVSLGVSLLTACIGGLMLKLNKKVATGFFCASALSGAIGYTLHVRVGKRRQVHPVSNSRAPLHEENDLYSLGSPYDPASMIGGDFSSDPSGALELPGDDDLNSDDSKAASQLTMRHGHSDRKEGNNNQENDEFDDVPLGTDFDSAQTSSTASIKTNSGLVNSILSKFFSGNKEAATGRG
jgi:hypothetical protein